MPLELNYEPIMSLLQAHSEPIPSPLWVFYKPITNPLWSHYNPIMSPLPAHLKSFEKIWKFEKIRKFEKVGNFFENVPLRKTKWHFRRRWKLRQTLRTVETSSRLKIIHRRWNVTETDKKLWISFQGILGDADEYVLWSSKGSHKRRQGLITYVASWQQTKWSTQK